MGCDMAKKDFPIVTRIDDLPPGFVKASELFASSGSNYQTCRRGVFCGKVGALMMQATTGSRQTLYVNRQQAISFVQQPDYSRTSDDVVSVRTGEIHTLQRQLDELSRVTQALLDVVTNPSKDR